MIEKIADPAELQSVFYRCFSTRDPFEPAGLPSFPIRAVLYETWSYWLTEAQFEALNAGLKAIGEDSFVFSNVECEPEERVWTGDLCKHWRCFRPTLEEYQGTGIPIESAIYSTQASWGILISHEDHGLLVCGDRFWAAFSAAYPHWHDDRVEFASTWLEYGKKGVDVGWLRPFLDHLTIE